MYLCSCKRGANSGHGDAQKRRKQWWFYLFARDGSPGTGKRGASGGGRVIGRGELGDVDGGLVVRGVGGSTGCPECTEVSRGRCKRGKEWQRKLVLQ